MKPNRVSILLTTSLLALLAACSQVTPSPASPELQTQEITGDGFGSAGPDGAHGVAAYGSGVYTVGQAGNEDINAVIRKTSRSGTLIWESVFGSSGKYDGANAVAVDKNGNAYVAGQTEGSISGQNRGGTDMFLRRYDPNGKVAWTRQIGTSGFDSIKAVALDKNGNVYIAGVLANRPFVQVYDPNSNFLRGLALDMRAFKSPLVTEIGVDGSGNIYVAGTDFIAINDVNGFIQKIAAQGSVAWTRAFSFSDRDTVESLTVDAAGNSYIAGHFMYSATDQDVYLLKYDANSNAGFVTKFGSTKAETVGGVGRDASGNLYLAGSTSGTINSPSQGFDDIFVRKFDAGGNTITTVQYGTPGSNQGETISALSRSELYVAGVTNGNLAAGTGTTGLDAFTSRLDAQLKLIWTHQ